MYVPPLSKILVSSGSFHHWFSSLPLMRRLDFTLQHIIFNDLLLDGLEISVSHEQLRSWTMDGLSKGNRTLPEPYKRLGSLLNKRILKLRSNTLHLDSLAGLSPTQLKALSQQLSIVHEHTGIREFTVHPDGVSATTWRRLIDMLPETMFLSVENMDPRKTSGRTLPEIQQLLDSHPNLRCTFDVCHWIENGYATDSEELKVFLNLNASRISKLHYSVPKSENEGYREIKDSYHCMVSGSETRIASEFYMQLQPGLTWVIEGVVPPNNAKLLMRELNTVRDLSSLSSMPKRRAASR